MSLPKSNEPSRNAKVVIIIIIIAIFVFAAIPLYKLYSLDIDSPESFLKPPEGIKYPAVLLGDGLLAKSRFVENETPGLISDIALGELDANDGTEVCIAGSDGAIFTDKSGVVKTEVDFKPVNAYVNIVDIEGDGVCEFMIRGSWDTKAGLLDHQGNVIWEYQFMVGVDDMDMGDIDGDGTPEFVVGFNGGGGVHLLDSNGRKIWSRDDGNVWQVAMVDTNDDGKDEILHSNVSGHMRIRDSDGKITRSGQPGIPLIGHYSSSFSITRWPTESDKECVLATKKNGIFLSNFQRKKIKKFKAPLCDRMNDGWGTPVRLRSDQPEYFAAMVEFRRWNRSIFYLYDPKGKLIYQEILPDAACAIAAIPIENTGLDSILIGGINMVWKYDFKE